MPANQHNSVTATDSSPIRAGDTRGRSSTVAPLGTARKTSLSLVLPMFNESPCVNSTLQRALATLEKDFVDFEIVVADDASTDDSAAQVERWVAKDSRIRLVRLSRNQRFGGALVAGLGAARKEFLVYTDFDLQVGLECLPHVLKEFADADVLTAYAADATKHVNWQAMIFSRTYNLLVRTLFGLRLRDINFGFKALRRTVWDQLALRSHSPFVDAEMFVQVRRLGYAIKEVPVPFSHRQLGTSHIRRLDVIAWTLFDMARLRLAPPRRRPALAPGGVRC